MKTEVTVLLIKDDLLIRKNVVDIPKMQDIKRYNAIMEEIV